MNTKFIALVAATISIMSCSTIYKNGQTPDDVYFSPVRGVKEKNNEKSENRNTDDYEEREIRMSTRYSRWRHINDDYDYNCSYDPYRYGYNYGYYYNPYYYNRPIFINGYSMINPKNTTPRITLLGSYKNTTLTVSNPKSGQTKWVQSTKNYNNSNNSFIRRVITPIINATPISSLGRGSDYDNNNNTRSYSPSSGNNQGSNSSSGSSSPAPAGSVTRPARGN